jgi:hypothetical protein
MALQQEETAYPRMRTMKISMEEVTNEIGFQNEQDYRTIMFDKRSQHE